MVIKAHLIDRWRRWKASGIPWSVRMCWATSDVISAHWLAIALVACACILALEIAAIFHVLGR